MFFSGFRSAGGGRSGGEGIHTGALTLFLCSWRSFPAVHESTTPVSILRGTHGGPGPADSPHGGPAGRPNRLGPTPSRPVSAVRQGQDERITRDPAYKTCSTPCWPCWYTHVRVEARVGYEGKAWADIPRAGVAEVVGPCDKLLDDVTSCGPRPPSLCERGGGRPVSAAATA